MSLSDYLAITALLVSLLSLFLTFTTKFTDFAAASWENIFGFLGGLIITLVSFVFGALLAYQVYMGPNSRFGVSAFLEGQPQASIFLRVPMAFLMFAVGFMLARLGVDMMNEAIRAERKQKKRD